MRVRQLFVVILLLGLPFASNEAAAQRDITGAKMSVTKWQPLKAEDSIAKFVGQYTPKIRRRQFRMRNKSVYNERLLFVNPTDYPGNLAGMFTGTAAEQFSRSTTETMRNKSDLLRRAKRTMKGLSWFSEVKQSANRSGRLDYVLAGSGPDAPDKCLYARQGFNLVTTTDVGEKYRTIVSFGYCDRNTTEKKLLEVFATLRINDGS